MATYTLTLKYGASNASITTNCNTTGVYKNGSYWYKITSSTLYRSSTSATSGFSQISNAKTATSGSSGTSKSVYWDLINIATPGYVRTGYHVVAASAWKTPGGLALNQDATSATATNAPTVYRLLENKYISANKTVTIQPNWVANTYTINYSANGGSFSETAPTTSATYNSNVTFSSTTPTRTGYTFLGWSSSSSATSATWTAGQTTTTAPNLTTTNGGSVTVYAVWQANTYSVGFNDNQADAGSTGLTVRTMTYGSTTNNSVTVPTRIGYTFKGYYTALTSGTQVYNSSGNAVAGTYWASGSSSWTQLFYEQDGTIYGTPFVYDTNKIGLRRRTGSTATWFGWNGATWDVITQPYSLTFFTSGSYSGCNPTPTSRPSHTGDLDASWYTSINGITYAWIESSNENHEYVYLCQFTGVISAGAWQYADNLPLYAQWTANSYTYTLNPNGGTYNNTTGTTSKTVTSGSTTNNSPGIPTRPGYAFNGWYTEATGGTKVFDSNGNAIGDYFTGYWYNASPTTSLNSGAYYIHYGTCVWGFYANSNGGTLYIWDDAAKTWGSKVTNSSLTTMTNIVGFGNLVGANAAVASGFMHVIQLGNCCNPEQTYALNTATQLGPSPVYGTSSNAIGSTTLPTDGVIWIGITNPTFYAHWTRTAPSPYIKVNGTWKTSTPYIKVGGTWKEVATMYVKVNGTWKQIT